MKKISALLLALVLSTTALSIKAQEGWSNENGVYYYYENGNKKTGWFKDEFNCWYYLDYQTGAMQTGWVAAGDYWYYLNPNNGIMQTGWLEVNGNKYYLDQSGAMYADGTKTIDGKMYNFNFNGILLNEINILDGSLPAGKYIVGKDIEPGVYILYNNEEDKRGKVDTVDYLLAYDDEDIDGNVVKRERSYNIPYSDLLKLSKGQQILITKGFIIPLEKSYGLELKTSGYFVVGVHIPKGTYIAEIANNKDFAQVSIYSLKNQDKLETVRLESQSLIYDKTSEITLKDGQYISIRDCILTAK